MPKSETTEWTPNAEENFKQFCALKGRTETTARLADILMDQYIKELVGENYQRDAVFSEVRPNTDLVREDLEEQLDRVLAENPAIETQIKQRISDLYDDVTGPQSLHGEGAKTEGWKERLYEDTLDKICEETFAFL